MANLPPLSLYIHIPWCVQKCPYCDFNSHALKGEVPHDDYVAHLLADLDADVAYAQGREVKTIFIGGGTPSLLSGPAMQTLLDGVRARLNLAADAEITMEANPGTVEADRFVDYQRAEFTRYTGLPESVIRPQIDEALAQGYLTECEDYWQITEHGKLFLNSLLELFLADDS